MSEMAEAFIKPQPPPPAHAQDTIFGSRENAQKAFLTSCGTVSPATQHENLCVLKSQACAKVQRWSLRVLLP